MSGEIQKYTSDLIEHLVEDSSAAETIKRSNRVVIYGTNEEGAHILEKGLEDYLKMMDVPKSSVWKCRNISNLKLAFFGIGLVTPGHTFQTNPEGGATLSIGKPLTIEEIRSQIPTTPSGVIIFRYMLQRDFFGQGMAVPTPMKVIEKLCTKYQVPIIKMEEGFQPEQFSQRLANLLPPGQTTE